MHPVIARCPICSSDLVVSRLHCAACDSTIEGRFSLGPLQRLSTEQIQFVEAFIRNRGSLKDLGAELQMSYPTVNSRLNDVLIAMGYSDRTKVPEPEATGLSKERKREILTAVRDGSLSAAEAESILRGDPQKGDRS